MTDSLRKSIESLRTLSPKLNAATDEANKVVQLIEKFLNEECQLGVPASYPYEEHRSHRDRQTGEPFYTKLVGYGRVNGRFRIVVIEREPEIQENPDYDISYCPENENVTAWSESTRGEKLESFQYLPKLLTTIATQVEEQIKHATAAASEVNTILEALAPAAGKTWGEVMQHPKK